MTRQQRCDSRAQHTSEHYCFGKNTLKELRKYNIHGRAARAIHYNGNQLGRLMIGRKGYGPFTLFPTNGRTCVWSIPKQVGESDWLLTTIKQLADFVMIWTATSYSIERLVDIHERITANEYFDYLKAGLLGFGFNTIRILSILSLASTIARSQRNWIIARSFKADNEKQMSFLNIIDVIGGCFGSRMGEHFVERNSHRQNESFPPGISANLAQHFCWYYFVHPWTVSIPAIKEKPWYSYVK